MKSRGRYRRHSTPFKLQRCQDIRNDVIGRRDAQLTHGVDEEAGRLNGCQLIMSSHDQGESDFIAHKFDAAGLPCSTVLLTALE